MSELTLFDLNSSKDFVKELSLQESKTILGGQETGGSSGGGETGGSESGGGSDDEDCTATDIETRETRPCTEKEREIFN